jgi:hypothetical protein
MPLYQKIGSCLLGLATLSGCHQIHDCIDEQVTSCCNHSAAMRAWIACRGRYVGCQDFLVDFGHGFRQGYEDVAGGATGCTPNLPPRKYWSVCYRSDEGQCAVVAWFDGYQHGAAVALADGAGGYNHVPTSDEIYRKGCRGPVAIDLEQYKASHGGSPNLAPLDGDLPPMPEGMPGEMTPQTVPMTPQAVPMAPPPAQYSPRILPGPARELGPAASIQRDLSPGL